MNRLSLLLALALTGCMKPNPLIYTLGEADEQAGSESGDGDDDDDDDDAEAESVLPDLPSGQMCEPLDPFGVGCGECLALDCCELALACAEVDECLCLADCVLGGGNPGSCKNECGGVTPSEIDELEPLLECAISACDQAC
jgi:hypothetical protein